MSKTRLDWLELISYGTAPTDTDAYQRGICFIGTSPYYWTGTAWVAFSSGGSSTTWENLYALDNTFNVSGGSGFTIAGSMANSNNVLTVTVDSSASGAAIAITQAGSGNDILGTSSTWSVSKAGAATFASETISGTAGSNIFTVTAGDLVVSDGSLTMTDADNAATFSVTNNTATTASVFVFAGSGVFTGSTTSSFFTITPSGLTTGTAVYLPVAGLTTGKALHVVGNALTSGILMNVTSSATAITGAGRLFASNHTGTTGTSGILNEFSSAATDETVILKVTASAALALGTALQVSGASITTGKGIEASDLNALTTGIGLHVASSATAITGAGRLLYVNHTGATGTSATLAEIASAANDETVVFKVTGSAALAGGKLVNLSAAALTTGTILDISDNTAATTGKAVNVVMNSADTGTRSVVYIKQDHASASGATALEVAQDGALAAIKVTSAATSTNYFKIATMNGVTLWMGNGTGANGVLSGTAGDILFNGASNKPEYCTGTTTWVALV